MFSSLKEGGVDSRWLIRDQEFKLSNDANGRARVEDLV